MSKATAFGLSALLAFSGMTGVAFADDGGISLVRDAETENLIRDYALPIWRAAGLTPSSVHVYLVQDDTINAFVAGGQRLFINTGLITQIDEPMELYGVIAHETGHMAGGHLARSSESLDKYKLPMIASMVLGIGAMAAGAGDAGMAVLAGGAQFTQRSILAYSREQEARADQAGATFLERAGLSGKGMLDLFSKFRDEEALTSTQQDPFVRSHPVSEDRLSALEDRVKASPYYNKPDSPERIHAFKMVQAKLNGFIDDPEVTFRRYPSSDQSDYAHYARTIAYHKEGANDKALAELAPLLKKEPDNPYLWELRGQVQFEGGKVAESIPDYRRAHQLMPDEPQLQLELAQALLAVDQSDLGKVALAKAASASGLPGGSGTPELRTRTTQAQIDREALSLLDSSVKADPENPFAYYQLSIAYGRTNNIGMAELATAEYYDAIGEMREARGHAMQAQKLLKEGSPEWLRAQDILTEAGGPGG